jgi:hypothetical protein
MSLFDNIINSPSTNILAPSVPPSIPTSHSTPISLFPSNLNQQPETSLGYDSGQSLSSAFDHGDMNCGFDDVYDECRFSGENLWGSDVMSFLQGCESDPVDNDSSESQSSEDYVEDCMKQGFEDPFQQDLLSLEADCLHFEDNDDNHSLSQNIPCPRSEHSLDNSLPKEDLTQDDFIIGEPNLSCKSTKKIVVHKRPSSSFRSSSSSQRRSNKKETTETTTETEDRTNEKDSFDEKNLNLSLSSIESKRTPTLTSASFQPRNRHRKYLGTESSYDDNTDRTFPSSQSQDPGTTSLPPPSGSTLTQTRDSRSSSESNEIEEESVKYTISVLNGNELVSILPPHDESAIDVCGYDNSTYVLFKNGNILRLTPKDQSKHPSETTYKSSNISCNILLERILSFGGYLFGVGKGSLYQLDSRTYSTPTWKWNKCLWAPTNITWVSSTLTGSHLWIQCSTGKQNNRETCYLYQNENSRTPKQVHQVILVGKKRVYGLDVKSYLEIHLSKHTAIKYPTKNTIDNIVTGALTYDGDIIRISESLSDIISDVRIVHWEPHYISKE